MRVCNDCGYAGPKTEWTEDKECPFCESDDFMEVEE